MQLRLALARIAAVVLTAAALPTQAAGWLQLQSENFTLHTRIHESAAREYIVQLEDFRWLTLQVLGLPAQGQRAQARFDMVLLPKGSIGLGAVNPQLKEYAGAYISCGEGSAAFGVHHPVGRGGIDYSRVVLQHEYAHRLMFQHGRQRYPAWYVEGFAEYLASASFDGAGATLGTLLDAHRGMLMPSDWLPFEDVLRWRELAIRALAPLTGNPHASALAAHASRAIAALRAGKTDDEVLALLAEPQPAAKP